MMSVLESEPLVVQNEMDDEQFFRFCQLNRDLRIERNARGELILTAPLGGQGGHGELRLARLFDEWAERQGSGLAFGSNTGFKLPNGAIRSPDISWVRNERLEKLSDEEWRKFLPLCPDFVLELRSQSDSLRVLKEKMGEYMANGAQLGWLLDPIRKEIHVYTPSKTPETLENPLTISGEPVLRGSVLDVPQIWASMEKTHRNPA